MSWASPSDTDVDVFARGISWRRSPQDPNAIVSGDSFTGAWNEFADKVKDVIGALLQT
jgi:hypothetical protein